MIFFSSVFFYVWIKLLWTWNNSFIKKLCIERARHWVYSIRPLHLDFRVNCRVIVRIWRIHCQKEKSFGTIKETDNNQEKWCDSSGVNSIFNVTCSLVHVADTGERCHNEKCRGIKYAYMSFLISNSKHWPEKFKFSHVS